MLVKYIGHRPEYRDALYGTGDWSKNQVKEVATQVAGRMLKHPDVYTADAFVKAAGGAVEVIAEPAKENEDDGDQIARDAVAAMSTKDAVADYARINFNQAIPKTLSLENMKQRAVTLIDQYGAQ